MTRHLTVVPVAAGHRVSIVDEPVAALAAGGLSSPVHFLGAEPATPLNGLCVLLFGGSSRAMIAQAVLNVPNRRGVFLTHGLASVGVFLPDDDAFQAALQSLGTAVAGYEAWPIQDDVVVEAKVERHEPPLIGEVPEMNFDTNDLPYVAAAQVRQFRRSVASLYPKVTRYAPEFEDLFPGLIGNVEETLEIIAERTASDEPSQKQLARYNSSVASLIEVNSGLAMLGSQLLAGNAPLTRHDYPVGEYSLFGIGGATRGLYALYSHLNRAFSVGDPLGRLRTALPSSRPFPFFRDRQQLDLTTWDDSVVRLERLPATGEPDPRRHHIVFFSSRNGFHETRNTMSASWQAIHAGASRDFNLLTLSHEFLHAIVREVLAVTLGRYTPTELADIINADDPQDGWESLAGALISGVHHCERVREDLVNVTADRPDFTTQDWTSRVTPEEVAALVEGQSRRYLQEVIVHSLDYLYVYSSDPDLYVSSIWGSWTHVPVVMTKIPHYLLRTLAALSAGDAQAEDPSHVYTRVHEQLRVSLEAIEGYSRNPVVGAASEFLNSERGNLQLEAEFRAVYYLARLARSFLYDPGIARPLLDDSTVNEHGEFDVDVGDGRLQPIESPIAFLLDRYRMYRADADAAERSRESLWQLLLLV